MTLKDHTTTAAQVARDWSRACDKLEAELHATERRLLKAEVEIERRDRLIARFRSLLRRLARDAQKIGEAK